MTKTVEAIIQYFFRFQKICLNSFEIDDMGPIDSAF